MALYPTIHLIDDIDPTTPADNEVVCKLPVAQRQMKAFVKEILLVAHNPNGTIKVGAIPAGSFATGAITADDIAVDAVTAPKILAGAVTHVKLAVDAVEADNIKAGAVTNDKLAAAGVHADRLTGGATYGVADAQIKPKGITAASLADAAVETAIIKDSAVTTAKIANGTILATDMNPGGTITVADPTIPVLAGAGGVDSAMAKIRGVLRATLSAGELVFTYATAGAAGSSVNYARCEEQTTGGLIAIAGATTIDSWNTRGAWIREVGDAALITVASGTITVVQAGTYLVWFHVPGYCVGQHQAVLCEFATPTYTPVCYGTVAYAAPGAQTESYYGGLLSVATAGTTYRLQHWCELTKATNGKGLAAISSVTAPKYGMIEFLKL